MISLDTKHFGPITVDDGDIVIFPEGIPGFEDGKKYTLLGKDEDAVPFFWLQSLDDKDFALVVIDPFAVYEDYSVDVDDDEITVLGVRDPERILTLCVVVIPEDMKQMRANLKAPILINLENNIGKQIVQHNEALPIRYFLLQ